MGYDKEIYNGDFLSDECLKIISELQKLCVYHSIERKNHDAWLIALKAFGKNLHPLVMKNEEYDEFEKILNSMPDESWTMINSQKRVLPDKKAKSTNGATSSMIS